MKRISLILPVYKVEKYIAKCLDSCISQNIPSSDYEIIVVNDGSPDNCKTIVEDYIKTNANIRLVNQENKGLSGARNTGLKYATGEYIWFIDSDDWIETNILKDILSTLDGSALDLMWLNWNRFDESNNPISQFKDFRRSENSTVMSGADFMENVLLFCTFAWSFIFKRTFLLESGQLFTEGITFEDIEFIPRVLVKAQKVRYYVTPVYNYLWRESSITSINNPKKIEDLTVAIRTNAELARNYPNIDYLRAIQDYLVLMIIRMLADKTNREKRAFLLRFLKENRITRINYANTGVRKLMALIFNVSPRLCISLSSLIARQ